MAAHQRAFNDVPGLPASWTTCFEYPKHPHLGGGAFAKIYQVVERSTGQKSALKVMQRSWYASRGMETQLRNEVSAMQRCAEHGLSRYVVKLFDAIEDNGNIFARMELCQCSLLDVVQRQPGSRLTDGQLMVFGRQLCQGLQDLHSAGILHRDIKPENLLIAADGVLKIADFGWCTDLHTRPTELAGTFQFMAPEILESQVQTEAVDVWSAGATLFELAVGGGLLQQFLLAGPTGCSATDPHQANAIRKMRLLAEIRDRCPLPKHGRPDYVPPALWDLLQTMLMPCVAERIPLPGALGSAFLQDTFMSCPAHQGTASYSGPPRPATGVVQNYCTVKLMPNPWQPTAVMSTPMKDYGMYVLDSSSPRSSEGSTAAPSTNNSTPDVSPRTAITLRPEMLVGPSWAPAPLVHVPPAWGVMGMPMPVATPQAFLPAAGNMIVPHWWM